PFLATSILKNVNNQEFEKQYQASMSKILNDLQSIALVSSQLESMAIDIGTSVQNLNEVVREYMNSQDAESSPDSSRS
ncbi:MAG: hypothetical protein WA949_10000, partial [Phormidesmis sp.]